MNLEDKKPNEILEAIEESFNFWPKQILHYIHNAGNIYLQKELMEKVHHELQSFHCITHERWDLACKEYNVNIVYKLPEDIFNKISQDNLETFISTWNNVIPYLHNKAHNLTYNEERAYLLKLLLSARTMLIQNYGYFDKCPKNTLFRVN